MLVVTGSMILSPLLLTLHDALFKKKEADGRPFDTPDEIYPKVIIAGFGRFGQIVGRILRAKRIAFTALEANQTQVDFLRRFGNQVFYGDASRLELLRAAHAENAEVFVLAIDDVEASVRTAELVAQAFSAFEDLRARAQSPACVSAHGLGRALHHSRNAGLQPGNVGEDSRNPGTVEIQLDRDGPPVPRPR